MAVAISKYYWSTLEGICNRTKPSSYINFNFKLRFAFLFCLDHLMDKFSAAIRDLIQSICG